METLAAQDEPRLKEAEAAARKADEAMAQANATATEARRIAELRDRDEKHLHFQLDLRKMRDRRKDVDADRERRAKAQASLDANRVDEEMARRIRQAHADMQAQAGQTGTAPSLIEFALSSMTILYGGLLGVFALAIFTKRRLPDWDNPDLIELYDSPLAARQPNRLDYIFVSNELLDPCGSVQIFMPKSPQGDDLSDHYGVLAIVRYD